MAEYVVIDKEQLESDLTVLADAIREKGGTSEQLAFPLGMKSAVDSIQSGGSNFELANYLTLFSNAFKGAVFPSGTEINLYLTQIKGVDTDASNIALSYMFSNAVGLKSVKIKTLDNGRSVSSAFGMFQSCKELVLVDFSEFKYEILTCGNMFYECQNLETILGELKIIETNAHIFSNVKKLKEVRLARGMLRTSISFTGAQYLSDASIDSIVNGFADMTGQTSPVLTVHKDVKAKIEANQTWLSTLTSKNVTLA